MEAITFLPAAMQIQPIRQGEVDSLCGLYTAINAIRLISSKSARRVFRQGIAYLDERHWLGSIATDGMPNRIFLSLLRHLTQGNHISITKLSSPEEVEQAVRHNRPVLLSVSKPLDHYTILCGYSTSRWYLFDSHGYHWLSRKHCSFTRRKGMRNIMIAWAMEEVVETEKEANRS